jgi:hypothetical protein
MWQAIRRRGLSVRAQLLPGRRVLAAPLAAFMTCVLVVGAWAVWTSGADASADSAFRSTTT